MASGITLRIIAFLVFTAIIGGGVYGAYETLQPDALAPRGLTMRTAGDGMAVTPGSTFSLGVAVNNTGELAESARVRVASADGFTVGDAVTLELPSRGGSGAFIAVDVAADLAPGAYALVVHAETVAEPVKRVQREVTVTVLDADAPAIDAGEGAVVQYVGRLAGSGALFDTNLPGVAGLPFPRTDYFRASTTNATLYTDPAANVFDGLKEALVGMREGETRTIRLTAENAYGPKEVEFTQPREESLPREHTLPLRVTQVSTEDFDGLVSESGRTAADFAVNDTFTRVLDGEEYRFRVTAMTNASVSYKLDPAVGEAFTIPGFEFWPGSAIVERVNATNVVFRVTPPGDGDAFTYYEHWPNATTVAEVGEEAITITHSPAVGTTFQRALGSGGQPVTHRVLALDADEITLAYTSPHPLAGEDVIFDVRILAVLPPRAG